MLRIVPGTQWEYMLLLLFTIQRLHSTVFKSPDLGARLPEFWFQMYSLLAKTLEKSLFNLFSFLIYEMRIIELILLGNNKNYLE